MVETSVTCVEIPAGTPVPTRPVVPLSAASTLLAIICDEIDDGAELTAVVKARFAAAKGELAIRTDEHIAFKKACEGLIAAAEQAEDAWRAKRRQIEHVLEAFKCEVKAAIQAEPDVPYAGRLGTLKLRKNGGKAKLLTKFLVREDKTLTNIIDPNVVELFAIDERFIETVTVTRLNTEEVRAALKEGPLPWAELERGEHVHGW